MTYRFPRLVRVVWTPQKGGARKAMAAVRLARSEQEAWDIANAVEFAMVPSTARRLVYQTARIDGRASARAALNPDTVWETFFREGVKDAA
jgi:hypothetical protein